MIKTNQILTHTEHCLGLKRETSKELRMYINSGRAWKRSCV